MIRESGPVAVAVSGGADSLYALASLREAGVPLLALHARLLPRDLAAPDDEGMLESLEAACASLGVPLHVVNLAERFAEEVIIPFVRAYAAGTTPNPCAACNARIKFGLLLDHAEKLGAARLATGHYAGLARLADGPALFTGADPVKDQSYFLSLVPVRQLARAVFPLAFVTKSHIRAWLAGRKIPVPAPRESQEICFVPRDDYRAFVAGTAARLGIPLPGPGPVQLPDGRCIAEHKGLWNYTEGQRRGLGIAWKEPLYVLSKNSAANTLIVGGASDPAGDSLVVERVNELVPFERWPETILVRTRYRQSARPATAERAGSRLILREHTPGGPHAAGQLAALYAPARQDGGEENPRLRLLGGGIIT